MIELAECDARHENLCSCKESSSSLGNLELCLNDIYDEVEHEKERNHQLGT